MFTFRTGSVLAIAFAALVAAACGGSESVPNAPTATPAPAPAPAPSPTPSPTPGPTGAPNSVTMTITASGLTPKSVTVARGGSVTFMNTDSITHVPSSNPHPVHTDCPELNVGSLAPGQSRATSALNTVRTCGFHDHNHPQDDGLKGTITIQ